MSIENPTFMHRYQRCCAAVRRADTFPELRTVLTAGRPSRFRILTVFCPNNHALVRVYQTTIGPVATFECRSSDVEFVTVHEGDEYNLLDRSKGRHGADKLAVALNEPDACVPHDPDHNAHTQSIIRAECACSMREVALPALRAAVADGSKRIAVGTPSPTRTNVQRPSDLLM